jgi:hypothetical protein
LQGLNGSVRAFRPHSPAAVEALINLSYQSFQQDFTAARATYLAAVANGTATPADMLAFQNYAKQRTNLLAQQVINSFLLYRQGTTRGQRVDSPLPVVLYAINGVADKKIMPRQIIPLVTQLTGLTPAMIAAPPANPAMPSPSSPIPAPGSSATTIALDTISQDNAIAAARVATLNSVTIVRNGNFGNGTTHH